MIAILLCWGLDGPLSLPLTGAFASIPAFAIFRELYNFAGLAQTCFVALIVVWLSRTKESRGKRLVAISIAAVIAANAAYIATQSSTGIPAAVLSVPEREIMRSLAQRSSPGRFATIPSIVPQSLIGDETHGGYSPWTIPIAEQAGISVPLAPFPVVLAAQDLSAADRTRIYERLGIDTAVDLPGVVTNLNVEPALRDLERVRSINTRSNPFEEDFSSNSLFAVEEFSAGAAAMDSVYSGSRDIGPFVAEAKQINIMENAGYDPRRGWAPLLLFPGMASWIYVLPSGIITLRDTEVLPFANVLFVVAGSTDGKIMSKMCSLYARIDTHFGIYKCVGSVVRLSGKPPLVISSASSGPVLRDLQQSGARGVATVEQWMPWRAVLHVRAVRGSVLVMRESYDSAWHCDGCGDAEHREVDGYANGWVLRSDIRRTVTLYFADGIPYFLCLALSISLLAAAAATGLSIASTKFRISHVRTHLP